MAKSQDVALLDFLLSAGCDPNLRVKVDKKLGSTPMLLGFYLKSFSVKEYLTYHTLQYQEHCSKCFNIHKPDFGDILYKAVKKYLSYGANPCIPNKDGYTCLMKAAELLDTAALKILKESFPSFDGVNKRDKTGRSAIMYAMDALSEKTANEIDPTIVQYLLEMGADPNAIYEKSDGDTVFMKAMRLKVPALLDTMAHFSRYPINHDVANKGKGCLSTNFAEDTYNVSFRHGNRSYSCLHAHG